MKGRINPFMFCAFVALFTECLMVHSATLKQVNELQTSLKRDYNKDTLPIEDQNSYLTVESVIELLVISGVDDVQELLSTVMSFVMVWVDHSMMWNVSEHHNIQHVVVDASTMWKPSLAVTNMHSTMGNVEDSDWNLIYYASTGLAVWLTKRTLETSCDMDMTYYPFDIQVCSVELFVYGYYNQINFTPTNFNETHLRAYKPHSTWTIRDKHVVSPDHANITIVYQLERDPTYMVVNFLVPLVVLALLNPLVFLLPPDSGERSGYSISIMLALSVFLTQLGFYLPQNSNPIPLITYLLMIWYILSAVSLFLLFISGQLYRKSDRRPVSRPWRMFVRFVRCIFCKDCNHTRSRFHDSDKSNGHGIETSGIENEAFDEDYKSTAENDKDPKRGTSTTAKNDKDPRPGTSWQDVSRSFDLFCMVSTYLVKIVFALLFMLMLSTRNRMPIHDKLV